ncbi:DUF4307 domain-containing protein [Microbacterium hominis]|uniref:DUF4307 domain-containing protein n=1 Tax=Microbacterium hominis TaxID=162426 RepID=A0A7D4QC60_9MICO|nr:DUF4307 domain-containing protein [Microbacterium hominis]QKJ19057.1 DUF4307 domain-containing protein [Microbacterium hominis]
MTTAQMLDERYGRARSGRSRTWLIVAIVVGAALAGLLGWSTVSSSLGSVDADTTGFTVESEHEVTLTFQFSGPVGVPIACALEAQDEEHGVVGWRIVEYPPSDQPARAFRETLPTTATATTGLVNSCWVS